MKKQMSAILMTLVMAMNMTSVFALEQDTTPAEAAPVQTVEAKAEQTAEPAAEPAEEPTAELTEEPTAELTEEPTAEPTEEPTAEPTEEPTAEPTAEPAEEPAPVVERSVQIVCLNEEIEIGDEVILVAKLTGFEDASCSLQWQWLVKNEQGEMEWQDVPGATGVRYTYTMTEELVSRQWRVLVEVDE